MDVMGAWAEGYGASLALRYAADHAADFGARADAAEALLATEKTMKRLADNDGFDAGAAGRLAAAERASFRPGMPRRVHLVLVETAPICDRARAIRVKHWNAKPKRARPILRGSDWTVRPKSGGLAGALFG